MPWLVPFLIYWFVMFVVSYMLVEYGHRYLYDEVPKLAPVRVAVGSLVLAIGLTWAHPSFETMYTADIKWTVAQAIVWAAVFTAVYAFQPLHGLGFALASLAVVAGMATIAVDTMTQPQPDERTQFTAPNTPLRKASGGGPITLPKGEAAKEK